MNKRSRDSFLKKLGAIKDRIALERDKLRELIDEAETIVACCDEALDDLDRAADALSQYL
jgi:ABC-type transporter Mla subunit MlaD